MSNKNDPYNYAHAGAVEDGKVQPAVRSKRLGVLVEMDSDMESVAGSVGKDRGQKAREEEGADGGKAEDATAKEKAEDEEKDAESKKKSEVAAGEQQEAAGSAERKKQDEKARKESTKDKETAKNAEDKKDQDATPGEDPPKPQGFFGGVKNIFFGFGQSKNTTPGGETPGQGPMAWAEFPWERYLVKEDIIKQWKQVDVKYINHLHANFDLEQAKFVNVELEEVSIIQTYSMVEGLVSK